MEKLTINIPEKKITLVKQILKELGVTIEQETHTLKSSYKEKLTEVSKWSEDDLKIFDFGKKAFDTLKPQKW